MQSTPGEGLDLYAAAAGRHRARRAERRVGGARGAGGAGGRGEPGVALLPFDGADDDRTAIAAGDRVLLVIAHDATLARDALAAARARGFKGARRRGARRSGWRSRASTVPTRC